MNLKEIKEILDDSQLNNLESLKSIITTPGEELSRRDKNLIFLYKNKIESLIGSLATELIKDKELVEDEIRENFVNDIDEEILEKSLMNPISRLIINRLILKELYNLYKSLFADEK